MPAIKITREQRQAIYRQLVIELAAVGDIHIALMNCDYGTARRYRREFEEDMRLLDALGWAPDAPGEEFELTADAAHLAAAVRRLHADAAGELRAHVTRPREDDEDAEHAAIACQAYCAILAALAGD